MKTIIASTIMALAALTASATAWTSPAAVDLKPLAATTLKVSASNVKVERSANFLIVDYTLNIDSIRRGTNRELWIEPSVVNGADTAALPAYVLAGRNRFYQAQRHGLEKIAPVTLRRDNYKDGVFTSTAQIPYEKWMSGADVVVDVTLRGCCSDSIESAHLTVARVDEVPEKFIPVFNWIVPTAEAVKTREIRGQAFIDFPVNQTVIYPEYRRNTTELAKIRATIDSVNNDPDITITGVSIRGYASPEGPWNNNVRLAKGRTAALKEYVERLYRFEPGFIQTSYDPEDWGGLRAYMQKSHMSERDAILEIIDSSLEPDAKDHRIKAMYPEQYAFLLAEVYPALRHSDYKIDYNIRSYTDVAEILALAKTRPQKLSLNEFFAASRTLDPHSPEYAELFETAVRMYPDSEVANLNAANAAMDQGQLDRAARYLAKAGEGPEVIYAQGVLQALRGNYEEAREFFEQAARLRVADAPRALGQIEALLGK